MPAGRSPASLGLDNNFGSARQPTALQRFRPELASTDTRRSLAARTVLDPERTPLAPGPATQIRRYQGAERPGYHASQRLSASPMRETGLPVPDQLAPGQLAQ